MVVSATVAIAVMMVPLAVLVRMTVAIVVALFLFALSAARWTRTRINRSLCLWLRVSVSTIHRQEAVALKAMHLGTGLATCEEDK